MTGFSATLVLYSLLHISGVYNRFGFFIYGGIHRAIILTFVLAMVFVNIPATRRSPRDRIPWYDWMFLLASLIPGLYLAVNILELNRAGMPATDLQQALTIVIVVASLEAARRAVGWIYALLGLLFFVYPFFAQYLPGILHGGKYSLQRVATLVFLQTEVGINGSMMHTVATIIIAFITFGAFLSASGIGQFFIDIAMLLMGRYRGGAAKVSIMASGLFGTVTASGVANVGTCGVITIPLMKKVGYEPHFAAAVEAVASTGGHFTPPVMASMAFIMAELLRITYWDVIVAAAIPAFLFYLALFIAVDLEAGKLRLRGIPVESIPSVRKTTANWFYALPLAVLLVILMGFHYEAETAAIYALVSVVAVSFFGKKENHMGVKRIIRSLSQGGLGILEVGTALAVGSFLVAGLGLTGLSVKLTGALVLIAGSSKLGVLLLAAAIALVMGLAVGPLPVYMTMALLVAPAMIVAGIMPIAAHMFLFILASAAIITPPVCTVAFVAASIAGSDFMRTGWLACRLGIVAFLIPFIFVYSPELLLKGAPDQVVLAVATAIVGIYFLTAGLEGYMLRSTNMFQRVLLVGAGVAMIIPGWTADVSGAAVGGAMLLWQFWRRRAAGVSPVASQG